MTASIAVIVTPHSTNQGQHDPQRTCGCELHGPTDVLRFRLPRLRSDARPLLLRRRAWSGETSTARRTPRLRRPPGSLAIDLEH
jgi:hypothetical protein